METVQASFDYQTQENLMGETPKDAPKLNFGGHARCLDDQPRCGVLVAPVFPAVNGVTLLTLQCCVRDILGVPVCTG
jgi:hypothetical protein